MVSNKSVDDLAHIARNGGGFVISARHLTVDNLAHIARNMQAKAYIEVTESDLLTTDNMAHISRNAVGQIAFS